MKLFKGIISVFLIVLFTLSAKSQYRFEYGFSAGAANILCDIGGKEKDRRDFSSKESLNTRKSLRIAGVFLKMQSVVDMTKKSRIVKNQML